MSKCRTAEEFAEAMKNGEEEIFVEADLKNMVIRIKAIGKVAWAVCVVSLTAAIAFYIAASAAAIAATLADGRAALVAGIGMSSAAAATLGSEVIPAIIIGVCGGGIGVLTKLRDKYDIAENTDEYLKLVKKKSKF